MSAPRARWIPLAIWALAMLLAGLWLATRLTVTHDLSVFLPAGASKPERLLLDELQSGQSAQLLLLAIEGGDEEARALASQRLAERLRQDADMALVINGATDGKAMQADNPVFAYRFLLSPGVNPDLFAAHNLHAALEQRLGELSSGMPMLNKRWLPHDPLGLAPGLMAQWQGDSLPNRRHGVWFDETGARALLLVHTRVAGFDLDRQEGVIKRIRGAFDALDPHGALHLRMTGPAVFAVQSRQAIRQESTVLSMAASMAGILILLLAYRSWRVVFVSALPVASAMVVGLCVTGWLTGPVHGIALAFAIVLVGITLDYPLHLFSHARPGETLARTASDLAPALSISALTTALAFGVLAIGDFRGLVQLGIMAATGILVAALVTRWVLPAAWPSVPTPRLTWAHGMGAVIRPTGRHAGLTLAAFAAVSLMAVLYVQSRPAMWEDDLAALSPIPSADRQLDQQLRQAMGAPDVRHVILIEGVDQESTLRQSEQVGAMLDALVQQGQLRGYDHAARYLPSAATQQARQQAIPLPEALRPQLATAMAGLPFRTDYFEPFIRDAEQARQLAPLNLSMLADTPLGIRVGTLLRQGASGWKARVVLRGVDDPAAVGKLLQDALPESAHFMDLKQSTEAMVSRFRVEALDKGLLIGGMILLILWAWRKSPMQLVRALLPVLTSLTLTVAMLLAMGERLNLFHLIALLLVLGLAVDYTVFLQAHAGDRDERARTAHALLACVASTSIVFALLATSSMPVLHAIGMTVALGVPMAVTTGIIMHRHGKPLSSADPSANRNP